MQKWIKLGVLGVIISIFTATSSWGQATTGSVTVQTNMVGSMTRHLIEWVSNASGDVIYEGLTTTGYLKHVEILSAGTPVTGVDTAETPTTTYDVKLLNSVRRNLLGTHGDDIITTSTGSTQLAPKTFVPALADGTTTETLATHGRHTLLVEDAGDSKKGWVVLYFDRYD